MTKPKVLISVMAGSGWAHKFIMLALKPMLIDIRVRGRLTDGPDLEIPTRKPYVSALSLTIRDVLNGGYDFWISMDDDNPPTTNIIDLVFLNKDVIGCPTPVWHADKIGDRPYYFNAMDEVDTPDGKEFQPHESSTVGLQQVDAVGSGCIVVARRVLEALEDQQPFMRRWDKKGVAHQSGDFSFSQKARAVGFTVWAHFDHICDHFNELSLLEVIRYMNEMKRVV